MDRWAGARYGEPCRECGFSFSIGVDESLEYLTRVPDELAALLAGASGSERHPSLTWSVASYVCHVADNVRIWAERIAGASKGAAAVVPYDENLLAEARSYPDVPLAAALWSVDRARDDLRTAVAAVPAEGIVVLHRERGGMGLEDIARSVAHDAFHHVWDIRRTLQPDGPPPDRSPGAPFAGQ